MRNNGGDVTSVSICGTELPSSFYGYCGTKFKFDQDDGMESPSPAGQTDPHLTECALAMNMIPGDPDHNDDNSTAFPYVLYAPKSHERLHRGMQRPDHVNVFLYEQTSTKTLSQTFIDT